jgi:hypothetical protein
MLTSGNTPFTTGTARYFDQDPGVEEGPHARIYVRFEPGQLGSTFLGLLDTGAPWCIFVPELAEALGFDVEPADDERISTRYGIFEGRLVRIPVRLLADEGESVEIQATVFVSGAWPGPNFLGYNGLLERLRFAIDPSSNTFHFGPAP